MCLQVLTEAQRHNVPWSWSYMAVSHLIRVFGSHSVLNKSRKHTQPLSHTYSPIIPLFLLAILKALSKFHA